MYLGANLAPWYIAYIIAAMRYIKNSRAYDQLAQLLKKLREEKGITIRQLASMLDVDHTVITKIENKRRKIDALELFVYADALGHSAEEIAVHVQKIMSDTDN